MEEGRLYSGSQFTRVHAIMSRKAWYQEHKDAFHYGEEGKALGMEKDAVYHREEGKVLGMGKMQSIIGRKVRH